MDGVDPRQNIGFANKEIIRNILILNILISPIFYLKNTNMFLVYLFINIGYIGIWGGNCRILVFIRENKEIFPEIWEFLIAE